MELAAVVVVSAPCTVVYGFHSILFCNSNVAFTTFGMELEFSVADTVGFIIYRKFDVRDTALPGIVTLPTAPKWDNFDASPETVKLRGRDLSIT
ncbi:MAG: hypothetical protein CMQ75_03790, partial [Gammaproteobacteria bacterium]|nr:hypothetical protein [Gammaproteobacteria bacterium]